MLRTAAEAQASAAELAAIVEAARQQVVAAYDVVRERAVWAATEKMSIEAIKDIADGRARLDELPVHGFFSVADVLRAGPDRLTRVPGIGAGSAAKVVAAAERIWQAARDSHRFRIELDPTDAETTRLLQALAVWAAVRHAGAARAPEAAQFAEDLAADRPVAALAAAGRLRRLFVPRRERASADVAAARIRQRLQHANSSGLLRAAHDIRNITVPSPEQVWRDFERRSVEYYGLLGQAVRLGGDVAAEGFLPADILERVNAQPLDTACLSQDLRLRGYQSFGARFILVQRRVVLGDEMGLGKTVQAIAVMGHLAADGVMNHTAPASVSHAATASNGAVGGSGKGGPDGAGQFLVVCPASVLINWTREIARHSTLPVVALHGSRRRRAEAQWRRHGGVAVTTFGSLSALLHTPTCPTLLVVDEAHYVKNPNAKRSKAVSRIAADSERVLFLTGTPMENRVGEFRALVAYLRPEIAGS